MKKRVITAVVALPLLLVVVLALPKLVTAILLAVCAAFAAYELLYRTELVTNPRLVAYSMVVAASVPIWCFFGMPQAWGLLGILAFLGALFGEMMANHIKLSFDKIAMCVIAGVIVPYLFSGLVRIHGMEYGRHMILIPFILAFLPDTGAYFTGYFFGAHKLAPVISPKKTIEGVIGGVLAAVIGMLLYSAVMALFFHFQVNVILALVYGVVVSLGDVFGDLMFSVIKRQTGIKDYGNLIPGHGGILDRFDSMMVVAPLTEALLLLIPMMVKL